MANIELVIFDCDGVLIDSEILSMLLWQERLADIGVSIDRRFFVEHFLGRSLPHVCDVVATEFGVVLSEAFLRDFHVQLEQLFSRKLVATTNIKAVLQGLSVPICVATSSTPERVAQALAVTELDGFFNNTVFTASLVEHGKPAPDLFLYAANKMAVAPERCLVIEDSEAGLMAATSAGMQLCRYVGASHFDGVVQSGYTTLQHWDDFFVQYPSLVSSKEPER